MSGLTLYSYRGDFRALKAAIAAQYNAVHLTMPKFELKDGDHLKPEVLAKNPSGKVPFLETPQGVLAESNAIARYIARLRRDTELMGRSFFESAQVDAWVDFASHDVELATSLWIYPILGWSEFNAALHEQAVADMHKALAILEAHLMPRTYLVGEAITLADIVVAVVLYYPFKLVFDAEVREAYPSVTRWFYTCVNQPQFATVLGDVPLCEKVMTPSGAPASAGKGKAAPAAAAGAGVKAAKAEKPKAEAKPKAETKPKEEKPKPAKKEVDPDAPEPDLPAEPKKKDPFAALPKSTMDLDEWKRTYSNSKTDYYASMPWFWDHLDKEGYSLWRQKYRFNEENKRDFMTSNLLSGFVQRTDELRRHAFGVMHALRDSAPYEVSGVWMIRGQDIAPMLAANDDAEYHDWIKLDPTNEEVKKMVADYWCAGEKLNGLPIMDSKVFK